MAARSLPAVCRAVQGRLSPALSIQALVADLLRVLPAKRPSHVQDDLRDSLVGSGVIVFTWQIGGCH